LEDQSDSDYNYEMEKGGASDKRKRVNGGKMDSGSKKKRKVSKSPTDTDFLGSFGDGGGPNRELKVIPN
jgi:hypothetical protein